MNHSYAVSHEHIRLRPLAEEDLELLRSWRNHPHIVRWFVDQTVIDSERQKEWYRTYLVKENDLVFMIEETTFIKQPIGSLSVYHIDRDDGSAEFGRFMIGHPSARGRGYGKQALQAAIRCCMSELRLQELRLEVFKDNAAAMHLYAEAGFRTVQEQVKAGRDIAVMRKTLAES